MSPLRILIVEDCRTTREMIFSIFNGLWNAEVFHAGTNREAFSILEMTEIHVIVQDLIRPGGSGIDLLKATKDDPEYRNIPVIVQSGNAAKFELEAWRAGAAAVMSKPYKPEKLIKAVKWSLKLDTDTAYTLINIRKESANLACKQELSLESTDERAFFARDVIAFANNGGGQIVLGIEKASAGKFVPCGISKETIKGLRSSVLNHAVRPFIGSDIRVVSRPVESNGRHFVIIDIPPSDTLLMPAKSNEYSGLYPGRIYCRNAVAESAEIQSPGEVTRIIDRLTKRKKSCRRMA